MMDKTVLDISAPPDSPDSVDEGSFIEGFAGYRALKRRMADVARHNINLPFFEPRNGVSDSHITWQGRELINFSGYNYLGLSGDPRVSSAAKAAIDKYGTSASASRIVSGQIDLHGELERRLADFLGTEDALVFVSGYLTNVTVISHLLSKPDAAIIDSGAHNSIMTGAKLSGARQLSFPVGEWEKLDALMDEKRSTFRRGLMVVEGVYSMDGHILDVRRAVEAKRRNDLLLMIDEAHSLGTIGATGRGVCEASGVSPRSVDVLMGTLSKSLAGAGGYIAGSRGLIEYLRFLAPGFIFSVGLSPPDTAAALAALKILESEPHLSAEVRDRARLFRAIAREAGLTIGGDEDSPVASLLVGDDKAGFVLSNRLLEQGIHVQPIPPPAVPVGGTRLRFFLTRTHTEEQFRLTLPAIAREMEQMGLMG
ncbi:MAG TPA: aminotransferase class I/II-fold pyridoxal phosphate-dependent enzyme [Rhizomicrobium sp.]|nr:aminotransferase class I/II-fold pyridoxal phosphate-dependent enzyme [Rhizomicrobium sp.]